MLAATERTPASAQTRSRLHIGSPHVYKPPAGSQFHLRPPNRNTTAHPLNEPPTTAHAPHSPAAADAAWMRHAIALALRARGQTHPNPLVGAVLVASNGELLAEGWHAQDGGPHAEIVALNQLHERGHTDARGATLYVTLEPCSTPGRTGACTDAIIRAGVTRVVIGAIDPCPAHSGNALAVLKEAGIRVSHGVLEQACADLNLIFNHRIVSGEPFIAAKVAVTLDGKIATRDHDSRWITGEAARADVMLWRRYFPAIGVGAGTVLADNPSLTARLPLPGGVAATPWQTAAERGKENGNTPQSAAALDEGKMAAALEARKIAAASATPPHAAAMPPTAQAGIWCPRRLIFDRSGKTAECPQATVFTDAFAHRTLVVTTEGAAARKLEPLRQAGIAVVALPQRAFGTGQFGAALRELLRHEQLTGLYVEGGSILLSHLLAARALDYLFHYRAPKLLADEEAVSPFGGQHPRRMADAFTLRNVCHETFGDDQLLRGHIVYPQGE